MFSLKSVFIFIFLVLFPFGQIIRVGIVQPIDVIVGLAAVYTIYAKLKRPKVFKYIQNFLIIASFSWFFSIFIFQQIQALYGLLYLFRLIAYSYFFIYVWNFAREKGNKELLIISLQSIAIISAVIGWVQFIVFPDIKPLFIWGWDMHLFRLVGTFFDPTFLGLIIVFGLLVFMYQYMNTRNNLHVLPIIFLLVSLAFTYSRASYLAFFAGVLFISLTKKMYKQLFIVMVGLVVLILILPTAKNHSIELFRSFSVVARVENYQSTLKIFFKSPVFGVGYDNMCIAYNKFIGYQKFSSHACSGSDSSLLFILATTGVLGLIVFIYVVSKIKNSVSHSTYYILLSTSFIALLAHSLFSNSMFYPWIMGWMVILLGLAL